MSKRSRSHEDDIKHYHAHLFPTEHIWAWLRADEHREFALGYEGGRYNRYNSFAAPENLAAALVANPPVRIDIGAVYLTEPKKGARVARRELVIDIDISDYGEDIRHCCEGDNVCERCWVLMDIAIDVIGAALRDNFGFKHVLWVFSGRRGIHAWVCDARAASLDDETRSAVCDFLSRGKVPVDRAAYPNTDALGPGKVDPRLDEAVTRRATHLLKTPFCAHPRTGKICVPISPGMPFNPEAVPTARDVRNDSGLCLRPYLDYLDSFIRTLETEP